MWSQSDRRVHQGLSDQVGLLSLFKLPEAVGRFGQEWIKVFSGFQRPPNLFLAKSIQFLDHAWICFSRKNVHCTQYGAIVSIQLLSHVVQPVSRPCWVISMSHTGFKQRSLFQWHYMQVPRGFSSGFCRVGWMLFFPHWNHYKLCQFKLTVTHVNNFTFACLACRFVFK